MSNPTRTEMMGFIQGKITGVETSIRAREETVRTFRGGTEAEWRHAAKLTGGKVMNKTERIVAATAHERIKGRLERECEMFRAVLELIS